MENPLRAEVWNEAVQGGQRPPRGAGVSPARPVSGRWGSKGACPLRGAARRGRGVREDSKGGRGFSLRGPSRAAGVVRGLAPYAGPSEVCGESEGLPALWVDGGFRSFELQGETLSSTDAGNYGVAWKEDLIEVAGCKFLRKQVC